MPIVQTNKQASKKAEHSTTTDSSTEFFVTEKCNSVEQLLLIKRASPSPVTAPGNNTNVEKLETKDDGSENDSINPESKQNNKKIKRKLASRLKGDNSRGGGRLLPKHAVAILKEWILSPEHFSFPYPTDEEKKMLMEKTGINSKQIKYWFINARRRLWKQKLVEQQKQSPSIIPNHDEHTNLMNNAANAPKPLSRVNVDLSLLQHQSVHPNMSSILTMTPQTQRAATALLHKQILLQQITVANAAAVQMASRVFVNSALQQRRHIPNHFVNAFLPRITLSRQHPCVNNPQFNV